MSISTPDSVPVVNQALEPAAVRNGNAAAKQAYAVGLEFEQVLVQQLSQEMANTTGSTDGSDDGSDDGTDTSSDDSSSDGMMGSSDPASATYASLLPQALTTGIMSAGGLGLAMQIAEGIDPALRTSVSSAGASSAASGTGAGMPVSGGGAV